MTGSGQDAHQGFGFGRGPILMGLVSLMLMLVAFFIVLVAMSEFDERRVRSALASIQDSFAGTPDEIEGDDDLSAADAIALQAVRDELAGLFATELQIDRIERTGGGAVEIDVAADRLFADGTAQLQPTVRAVLERVIAALERRPPGYRYEIDVLVGRGSEAQESEMSVARSGALVRAFIDAGAMRSAMAAGLRPEKPERVRLVLHLISGPRQSLPLSPVAVRGERHE